MNLKMSDNANTMEDNEVNRVRRNLGCLLEDLVQQSPKKGFSSKKIERSDLPWKLTYSSDSIKSDPGPHQQLSMEQRVLKAIESEKEACPMITSQLKEQLTMRIFDRRIYMGQFDLSAGNCSLYPMLRAWVENNPDKETRISMKSEENDFKENYFENFINFSNSAGVDFNHLPLPIKKEVSSHSDDTTLIRSPDKMKPSVTADQLLSSNDDITPQELFLKNMKHWKNVRLESQKESQKQEERYVKSRNILSEMYYTSLSQKDEDVSISNVT